VWRGGWGEEEEKEEREAKASIIKAYTKQLAQVCADSCGFFWPAGGGGNVLGVFEFAVQDRQRGVAGGGCCADGPAITTRQHS
jgi:hypothetical protein